MAVRHFSKNGTVRKEYEGEKKKGKKSLSGQNADTMKTDREKKEEESQSTPRKKKKKK